MRLGASVINDVNVHRTLDTQALADCSGTLYIARDGRGNKARLLTGKYGRQIDGKDATRHIYWRKMA